MVDQGMKATLTECPDPEVLAAYLAGRLPETERAAVTEHLADCADCYAVFIASAREYRGRRWEWAERIWRAVVEASGWSKAVVVTAALGTATASLTFFLRPQLLTQWWPGRSELTELVAAVGTERTIEPRLTGGFAYGPLHGPVRGGERTEERLSPELRIAALTLEKRVQGRRDPSSLAAYAAAELVTGQADRAVSALEEAAQLAPKNARVQNDLSAAYLVRSKEKPGLEDLNKALTAATAAIEADPSLPEARFNLALVLEGLSRRNEARKAWEAYLKNDSKSPWAREAKGHLDTLALERQSQRFDKQLPRIAEVEAGGNESPCAKKSLFHLCGLRSLSTRMKDHARIAKRRLSITSAATAWRQNKAAHGGAIDGFAAGGIRPDVTPQRRTQVAATNDGHLRLLHHSRWSRRPEGSKQNRQDRSNSHALSDHEPWGRFSYCAQFM